MRGRCEFPAGMLFVCPCSTPDVSSPLCRWSPSTARPPSVSLTTPVSQLLDSDRSATVSVEPPALHTLSSLSVSAENDLPPATSFSLTWAEILSLLKHSQQTPHPPPQSPYHSSASCHTLPSLSCCRLSSLFTLLLTQSTSAHAGSSRFAVPSVLRRV